MERRDDNYLSVETPKGETSRLHIDAAGAAEENAETTGLASYTELFQFADTTDRSSWELGLLRPWPRVCRCQFRIYYSAMLSKPFIPRAAAKTTSGQTFNETSIESWFLQIACWSIAASRQSKRLRHAYASAILRQEIGWFDVNDPMQLATRVADTTLLVQEGTGRKIGDGLYYLSMGLGSVIVGFIHGWELTLLLLAFKPLIGLSTFYMTKAITSAVQGGVDAYAEAGGIAEESLSNIKTVHMFNAMGAMADKYMIDRQPPIDSMDDSGIKLDHVKGDVELRGLDFCYPSRPDSKIYKNYNLKIKSGQTVALVGGSGSGKSTAINLIERFYDPNAGAVYLDGVDLKTINVQSLRNHISIVSQEPVLFVGTIGENIATGKPGATQAEIEDAAKKANAHD
ncbi:hypothetical protein LEN26_002984, partial [Aphanomyces euteiches]